MTEKRKKSYHYGLRAEKIAAWYLRCKGYRILAERYRNAHGEIDLLAKKGAMLIAIEVKARQSIEACLESIPPWKQQKIARAMEGFIATPRGKMTGLGKACSFTIRFDVIWIAPKRWPHHIRDAWRM